MINNITVASEWKKNFRMSHPTLTELCEDLRPLLEEKKINQNEATHIGRNSSGSHSLLFVR